MPTRCQTPIPTAQMPACVHAACCRRMNRINHSLDAARRTSASSCSRTRRNRSIRSPCPTTTVRPSRGKHLLHRATTAPGPRNRGYTGHNCTRTHPRPQPVRVSMCRSSPNLWRWACRRQAHTVRAGTAAPAMQRPKTMPAVGAATFRLPPRAPSPGGERLAAQRRCEASPAARQFHRSRHSPTADAYPVAHCPFLH